MKAKNYKELTLNYLRENFDEFKHLSNDRLQILWMKFSDLYFASWVSIDHETARLFCQMYVDKKL